MSILINVLGSGSSGNAILISSEKTTLLIDAGFSAKALQQRIEQLSFKINAIHALILSHEHQDHSKGWQSCAKFYDIPVFMTLLTQQALQASSKKKVNLRSFQVGKPFAIEDFTIQPFPVPHDAAEPLAFLITYKHHKIAIATDLGYLPNLVKKYLSESSIIILESNHDIEMLKNGPYPWQLKQRIMSRHGHLSNDTVGAFIKDHINQKCLYLFLAHISKKNNTPELALATSLANLTDNNTTRIILTYQSDISETVAL